MNEKPDESINLSAPAQSDAPAADVAETAGPSPIEMQLKQDVEALRVENVDLRDKLLRAIAEMENYRRRADREKSDVVKYAITEFARDAVSIGDNLRRAIEAVQKEPLDLNIPLKTLLEGVEVTERELLKVFERHGISRFEALGEKFDPHVHEAMIKVDVPNVAADVIVQVLQAGYKIADRVLRPAAVIVAKGGTVSQQPPPPMDETSDPNGVQSGTAGGNMKPFHEHDPDVMREKTGAPKGQTGQSSPKERVIREKRSSTVTKPVTESSTQPKKDDLISSFGKRLENGT